MSKLSRLFSAHHAIENLINRRLRRLGIEQQEVDLGQCHIEYWDSESEKPVLLLLPAFAPEAKYSWFKQLKSLSKKYRIVMPNFIFFGKSSMTNPSHHISDQTNAVEKLLDYLNIKSLSVSGISYGGLVALELALNAQFKIQKMVLTSPPLKFFSNHIDTINLGKLGVLQRSELLVPNGAIRLRELFNLTHHKKFPIPLFVFKNLFKNSYLKGASDKQKLVEHFILEREKFNVDVFPFDFPVLIIRGEKDKLVPSEIVEELTRRIGNDGILKTIARTAHMPNFEKPWTYNKIVLDFLEEKN